MKTAFYHIPYWKDPKSSGKRDLGGVFCDQSNQDTHIDLRETDDIHDWQATVELLAKANDFQNEPNFPYIKGINVETRGKFRAIRAEQGHFCVRAEQSLVVEVGHYLPNQGNDFSNAKDWIVFSASSPVHITRNHFIQTDSPYDIQDVRLKSSHLTRTATGYLSLFRSHPDCKNPTVNEAMYLFEIPITVHPKRISNIGLSFILGLLLFLPHIASHPDLSLWKWIWFSIIYLMVGFVGVYGIKKKIDL